MTIEEAQTKVDNWIKKYGVRYFNELTNLAILMEEVGELSRIMSRKFGEQSFKSGESGDNLEDELSDILFVLLCMSNQMNINLTQALENNLKKKSERDKTRHLTNDKLH